MRFCDSANSGLVFIEKKIFTKASCARTPMPTSAAARAALMPPAAMAYCKYWDCFRKIPTWSEANSENADPGLTTREER